jgi:Uma2 family endonuclease
MTVEEFLALPDDGVDRELICGEVVEKGMTVHNRQHSEIMSLVSASLTNWARQFGRRWRVLCGEAGFILQHDPATTVGIDVAVVSAEVMDRQTGQTSLVDGPPLLAIEILSPSDTQQQIHDKITLYLKCGVAAVWIIDPDDRTVRVYHPAQPPELFNDQQQLSGESLLPGFTVPVAELFA